MRPSYPGITPVDEFEGEHPRPANGQTGRNIAEYLLSVKGLSECREYGLILINAVQYQCSRGKDTKLFRDQTFREIWTQNGRSNFIERFGLVYEEGDLVINACTRGNKERPFREQLRCLVHSAVLEAMESRTPEPLRRNHPVRWNMTARQNYEWTYYP